MNTILWIIAILLVLAGVAGIVLPALPGLPLIFIGVLLAAWTNDFQLISVTTIYVLAALAILGVVVEYAATALTAKRAGASRQGMIGAALGTLVGIFMGIWGLLFIPLAGAAIGEYMAHKDMVRAGKVGAATWYGLIIAAVVKLAIAFTMLGIFIAALLI